MANTQRFRYKEQLEVSQTPASSDNSLGRVLANFPELDLTWGSGTTGSKSDLYWCDAERELASGASEDLDLTALAAAGSPTGAAVNMAEVRALFVYAYSTNTTTLTMDPGASNGWTALGAAWSLDLEAEVKVRLLTPKDGAWPVAADNKVLSFTNSSGAAAKYGILIVGVSA